MTRTRKVMLWLAAGVLTLTPLAIWAADKAAAYCDAGCCGSCFPGCCPGC